MSFEKPSTKVPGSAAPLSNGVSGNMSGHGNGTLGGGPQPRTRKPTSGSAPRPKRGNMRTT